MFKVLLLTVVIIVAIVAGLVYLLIKSTGEMHD